MQKGIKFLLLLVIAVVLNGCIFYTNPQVSYYDINQIDTSELPKVEVLSGVVKFNQFRNLAPVGNNFIYSGNDGLQEIDDCNVWIQSPERMIQRKFVSLIECDNNAGKVYELNGVLYDFAINSGSLSCAAAMKFSVKVITDKGTETYDFSYQKSKKISDIKPGTCAVAMAEIVAEIANELQKELTKF